METINFLSSFLPDGILEYFDIVDFKELSKDGFYLYLEEKINYQLLMIMHYMNQKERAQILFQRYPPLEQAYKHVLHLRSIDKSPNINTARFRLF